MVGLVIPEALERSPAIRSGILATCAAPALSIPTSRWLDLKGVLVHPAHCLSIGRTHMSVCQQGKV